MTIKDLLLHLDQGPTAQARVEATMALADRFGASVKALHLVAEPFMPGVAGHHMPEDVLREHLARVEAYEAVLGLFRRFPDLHLDPSREQPHLSGWHVRSFKPLHVQVA